MLRPLCVFLCDIVLSTVSGIKTAIKPRPRKKTEEELKIQDSLLSDLLPYDLVMEKERYLKQAQSVESMQQNLPLKWGPMSIGMVIGIINKNNVQEDLVYKVAHFNSAEMDTPEIKLYKADELMLVDSPIRVIQQAYNVSAAMGGLSGANPEKTLNNIDANLTVEELLNTLDKKKDDLIH